MPKSVKLQLKQVFENATAPYREEWVLEFILNELNSIGIPFYQDKWGNIIAGVASPRGLQKSSRTVLVAHTDHPGFHILKKQEKGIYLAQWHGGHPPKMKNSKLAVYNPLYPQIKTSAQTLNEPNKKRIFKIAIKEILIPIDKTCFGAFDFSAYKFKSSRIETRVADDLAGVVIILSVLRRLSKKSQKNFLGLFSTAEETGFKGTIGFLKDTPLSPKTRFISLEASREMEGAKIGKGPVIRLGDRRTIFNQDLTSWIERASVKKLFQKRIMNGGTCEATAFQSFGYKVSGIAIPLGNYHNQKKNGRPGPEIIDLKDVEEAVKILVQLYKDIAAKKHSPAKIFSRLLLTDLNKSIKYFTHRPAYKYRKQSL